MLTLRAEHLLDPPPAFRFEHPSHPMGVLVAHAKVFESPCERALGFRIGMVRVVLRHGSTVTLSRAFVIIANLHFCCGFAPMPTGGISAMVARCRRVRSVSE
jgi:hypothetical protein